MGTPRGSKVWNSGTSKGWVDRRGYRWIYVTEDGRRRAKREHRHLMEEHLGRKLRPEEMVHHKNGDPCDNRIENLEVTLWGPHTAEHSTGRAQTEYAKRTQAVIAEYRETVKHLRAVNAEMLEALRPLANYLAILETMGGPSGGKGMNGDDHLWHVSSSAGDAVITFGDLQRARAAIAKAEGRL